MSAGTAPNETHPPDTEPRCLSCGYSLRGAPPVGVCPECGHGHDPNSTALRLALHEPGLYPFVLAIVLTAVFLYMARRTGDTLTLVPIAVALFLYALWNARYWPRSRRWCVVLMNRDGVHIRHPYRREVVLPWEKIASVHVLPPASPHRLTLRHPQSRLVCRDSDGRVTLDRRADRLGGEENTARCAREIEARRAAYASA